MQPGTDFDTFFQSSAKRNWPKTAQKRQKPYQNPSKWVCFEQQLHLLHYAETAEHPGPLPKQSLSKVSPLLLPVKFHLKEKKLQWHLENVIIKEKQLWGAWHVSEIQQHRGAACLWRLRFS